MEWWSHPNFHAFNPWDTLFSICEKWNWSMENWQPRISPNETQSTGCYYSVYRIEIAVIERCYCPVRYIQYVCDLTHLTHWGRVTHICVSKRTIIGSDNGLSPNRRQAIIWTNAGILLIGPSGTNFSEILIEIITFSFKKMRLKVSSAKWRPCCLGLNVLTGKYKSVAKTSGKTETSIQNIIG